MASNQRNDRARRHGAHAPNNHPASARPASHPGQWRQNYERYKTLAESAGDADPVTRENYWQHAEHFLRLINGAAGQAG